MSTEPPPTAPSRRFSWTRALCLVLVGLSLLGPIALAGLWDPPELAGAEISRRIAVNVFGASELAIEGATNDLPSIEEVGRGELPFFLSALGFVAFGLHDWAGRLPLALGALLGVAAFYYACRRLVGSRHAALSALVLASMPLFFLQARTLLGDAITMACSAIAFVGLLLASADRTLTPLRRLLAFGLGLGFLALGAACRGVLVGVAIPALSVGLAWWLVGAPLRPIAAIDRKRFDLGAALGATTLLIGAVALGLGAYAYRAAEPEILSRLLGSAARASDHDVTHDFMVHHLGHALFPWSAFVPVALGLTLARPRGGQPHTVALQVASSCCAIVAVGIHTLIAPRAGLVPFSAPYALAGVVAFGLLELDRARRGAPVVAMCVAALAIVLFTDFRHFPDKSMSAFALPDTSVPERFQNTTKLTFAIATAPVLLVTVLLAVEQWPGVRRVAAWLSGTRFAQFRSLLLLTALTSSGLLLGFGYYPALAAHVSPVGVFETYRDRAEPGEPLATTGKGGNISAYYGSGEQRHFERDREALDWLVASPDERRWLIVKRGDLGALTSRYREKRPLRTLPVLDASSGDVMLVSNLLREGETNRNPLGRFLPEVAPQPAHPVQAAFGDKLRVIGWELVDPDDGTVVKELQRGRSYRIDLYYEVLGRITQNWKTFVHIDSSANRVHADHDTLDDQYPFRLWNPGDFIADRYVFDIEPDAVAGRYTLYFGLFSGKSRLDVTSGGDKDDRVIGGPVEIR